ncbi:MAG TPA: hypothetical protein VD947_04870, partial [Patescibacteria group bacterium]|nr:hypothetical protein [Patescibacteria group bacterium]
MLARIINETTEAIVAGVEGVDNILDAVTGTVKDQIINVLKSTGEVGGSTIEAVASVADGAIKGAGQV